MPETNEEKEDISINYMDGEFEDDMPSFMKNSNDDIDAQLAAKPTVPRRKRGRPPKNSVSEMTVTPQIKTLKKPVASNDYVERMQNTDIDEKMSHWDWDSGEYNCAIKRIQPQTWKGRNCFGFISQFSHKINEEFIKENFGGGVYDVIIRGPNPKTGNPTGFLESCRVKISGDPIIEKSLHDYTDGNDIILASPQYGPPSLKQIKEAQEVGMSSPPRTVTPNFAPNYGQNDSMLKMSFDTISNQLNQTRDEASKLRDQLIERTLEKASKPNGQDSEVLKMMRDTTDKMLEAERKNNEEQRKNLETYLQVLGARQSGIPPEIIQTINEQHRSEMNAMAENTKAQLIQERERHERELTVLRERYEREIEMIRNDLTSRLEREQATGKNELERVRETLNKQVEVERKEFERKLDLERDWAKRERESIASQHRNDRDSLVNQHQMQLDHVKSINENQQASLTSRYEAQIAQIQSQHKSMLDIQKTTFESRINSLESEIDRLRRELDTAKEKYASEGDLASQAKRIKDITESLRGVFDPMGGKVMSLAGSISSNEEVDQVEEKGGLLQGIGSLLGSEVGKQILTTILGAATGIQPPMQQPNYYQQPPQQQYYQPQPQHYGPPPRHPQYYDPEEEMNEEEWEEIIDEEEENQNEAQAKKAEPSYKVDEKKTPEPAPLGKDAPQAPPESSQQMTDEIRQQVFLLINGIEQSMANNASASVVAEQLTILPVEQLEPWANAETDALVDQLLTVSPDSIIGTFAGRKYIKEIQEAIKAHLAK